MIFLWSDRKFYSKHQIQREDGMKIAVSASKWGWQTVSQRRERPNRVRCENGRFSLSPFPVTQVQELLNWIHRIGVKVTRVTGWEINFGWIWSETVTREKEDERDMSAAAVFLTDYRFSPRKCPSLRPLISVTSSFQRAPSPIAVMMVTVAIKERKGKREGIFCFHFRVRGEKQTEEVKV